LACVVVGWQRGLLALLPSSLLHQMAPAASDAPIQHHMRVMQTGAWDKPALCKHSMRW
jgi:hypothetical protein